MFLLPWMHQVTFRQSFLSFRFPNCNMGTYSYWKTCKILARSWCTLKAKLSRNFWLIIFSCLWKQKTVYRSKKKREVNQDKFSGSKIFLLPKEQNMCQFWSWFISLPFYCKFRENEKQDEIRSDRFVYPWREEIRRITQYSNRAIGENYQVCAWSHLPKRPKFEWLFLVGETLGETNSFGCHT